LTYAGARAAVWPWALSCALVCVLGVCAESHAQAKRGRVKIDRVDTSQAPIIKLYATCLGAKDNPIHPDLLDFTEVLVDGKATEAEPDVAIWKNQPGGTDLVLVLPATSSLTESAFVTLNESLKEMLKYMGPEDRLGLVTYSYSTAVVSPLSKDKAKVLEAYGKVARKGQRPFMFSALEKAITELETSPEGRKRAILYLGDGTDAKPLGGPELSQKVYDVVQRADKNKIHLWTLGYLPGGTGEEVQLRTLQLMSRKTGATYRGAFSQRELKDAVEKFVIQEIEGQLVLTIQGKFEEGQAYNFAVRVQPAKGEPIESPVHKATVEKVKFNWILWSIVCGLTCVVVGVLVIAVAAAIIYWKRKKAREEAEALLANLLEEKKEKKDKEEEPLFVYDDQDRKVCNTCGRVCDPSWDKCLFDERKQKPLPEWVALKREEKALWGGKADAGGEAAEEAKKKAEEEMKKRQAAAEEAQKRAQALAAGGKPCPTCQRVMDPKWPECLYCASGLPPLAKK
jgi:hypothetical protein